MKTGMVCLAALMALGACASPYAGMAGMPMEGGEINAFPGDESDRLLAGLDAAEAQATRPGDAALSCDQLARETTSIALDPKVQGVVQRMGGSPQAMMAELKKQSDAQMVSVAAFTAMSLLSSVASRVPGLEFVTSGVQEAARMALEAQQASQNAQMAKTVADVQTIMPQIMRGRRVEELAQGKSCAFLKKPA